MDISVESFNGHQEHLDQENGIGPDESHEFDDDEIEIENMKGELGNHLKVKKKGTSTFADERVVNR